MAQTRDFHEAFSTLLPMLSADRIEDRLADAESLIRGGADIGDPGEYVAGLWESIYERAPMHLRSRVVRRLMTIARQLGVSYTYAVRG